MAKFTEQHTIGSDNFTASLLVWRRFRRPAPGAIEAILNANRGLADQGLLIPVGTVVDLPIDTDDPYRVDDKIRLWPEA